MKEFGNIYDGSACISKFYKAFKSTVEYYTLKKYRCPKLAIIQVIGNPASNIYIRNKIKACKKVGIDVTVYHINPNTFESNFAIFDNIVNTINDLNNDKSIDGIIVQLPIPFKTDILTEYYTKEIVNRIAPNKDVDGLNHINQGRLFGEIWKKNLIPATALGIKEILNDIMIKERKSIDFYKGKLCTIIGRSNLIGKPLMSLLSVKYGCDMTVAMANSHTPVGTLNKLISISDVVICCAGSKDEYLVRRDNVKRGAIVIDAAINVKIDEDGKRHLYGDADIDNIKDKCFYVTPVPGGVGPMTICMLISNMITCYEINNIK